MFPNISQHCTSAIAAEMPYSIIMQFQQLQLSLQWQYETMRQWYGIITDEMQTENREENLFTAFIEYRVYRCL